MDYQSFVQEIEEGNVYEDIIINKRKYKVIVLNTRGIFLFLQLSKEREFNNLNYIISEFHNVLSFNPRFIYTYVEYQDNYYYFNYYKNEIEEIESIEEAFNEVLENTFPTFALESEDETRMSLEIYENILDSYYFEKENVYQDEYGNEYRILPDGKDYLLSDLDSNEHFKFALFGGLFGIHKFREGRYALAVFYLLTFGGFGVGYIFDLIFMILGIYKYKTKITYEDGSCLKTVILLDKISEKKKACLFLLVALIVTIIYSFIYSIFMSHVFCFIEQFLLEILEQSAANIDAEAISSKLLY